MKELFGTPPESAVADADDLLQRLSEWDVLNLAPGSGDDGPYWRSEIFRVRARLVDERPLTYGECEEITTLRQMAADAQADWNGIELALFAHIQGRDLPEILDRISSLAAAVKAAREARYQWDHATATGIDIAMGNLREALKPFGDAT